MSRTHVLASLVCLALASEAPAQCPVQELAADVADFGHFGRDVAVSGSTLIVGSDQEQAAFLFEESGGGWVQSVRLRPPVVGSTQRFGSVVAISGDTAVVSDTQSSDDRGRVHVYVRAGATWKFQATLEPSDGEADDYFGASLAIDGDTIVARKSVGFDWAVHVFERTGTSWLETQKLTKPGITFFGMSLALDGDRLLIGDSGDATEGFNAGAAYFYERVGGAWSQEAKVLASNATAEAYFGTAVALDSDTAVIGAPAFLNPNRRGTGYVFVYNGTQWIQTRRLRGAGSSLESPVATDVSIEGSRILLGAPEYAPSNTPGSVYVFERYSASWPQAGKLRLPGGSGGFDTFGTSVAQVGGLTFVGAPHEGPGLETGRVHVFDMTINRPVSYCLSTPNSTNDPARIASVGSNQVAANDVTLIAEPVPQGEVGFVLVGNQQTQLPFWDGYLCVGRPFARTPPTLTSLNRLVQDVDLDALPFAVVEGSTWTFQAWFIDPQGGAAGANLSDGVAVTFCP